MKLLILLIFAVTLRAEDAKPTPPVTVDQLTAQVAEQKQQIAKLQQKLTIYQQSSFRCQDAMLDAQIDAQAKSKPGEPVK
jgi:uncharacterized coiled-coil protein SlyX